MLFFFHSNSRPTIEYLVMEYLFRCLFPLSTKSSCFYYSIYIKLICKAHEGHHTDGRCYLKEKTEITTIVIFFMTILEDQIGRCTPVHI